MFLLLSWLLAVVAQHQNVLKPDKVPAPIDPEIYSNLFTYAHLIDISYCVSNVGGIEEPFKCDLNCEKRFPNMTLVYQWYFDNSVCGYIATTYSNIFHYEDVATPKKTIILSLRGTRSLFDSYTDIKVDMTQYSNLRYNLPYCGANCKVHKGFYENFQHTLLKIHVVLEKELRESENYELLILGHSMGGAIGLLVGLHFLDLGYDKMTIVTMGQPLLGNEEFTNWADKVLGSSLKPKHNTYDRKYFRVVHKGDIVTVIPKSNDILNSYYQFDNQIYLNCSATTTVPPPKTVVDCETGDNSHCIQKDFSRFVDTLNKNYYESHNTYFRKLGLCGARVLETI